MRPEQAQCDTARFPRNLQRIEIVEYLDPLDGVTSVFPIARSWNRFAESFNGINGDAVTLVAVVFSSLAHTGGNPLPLAELLAVCNVTKWYRE